jgi:hypothetical protein
MSTEEAKLARGKTEAEAVAEIARAEFSGSVETVTTPDGVQGLFTKVPQGGGMTRFTALKPEDFDAWRDHPVRREGTAELTDLDSFIAHVRRFSVWNSALFANDKAGEESLTAVLDYHDPVNSGDVEAAEKTERDIKPRFGRHRSRYRFPYSREWKAWRAVDGEKLDGVEFAEFLEDHVIDIMPVPAFLADNQYSGEQLSESDRTLRDTAIKIGGRVAGPEKVMELSKGIQIHSNDETIQKLDLSSGTGQIKFQSDHCDETGAPITLPNLFLIAIPVFHLGHSYRIPVRLRYRSSGGKIAWTLLMHRPDICLEHALKEAFERAAAETDLPLFRGAPE